MQRLSWIKPTANGDVMGKNLLEVLPRLKEKDCKIIKLAVDKCGSKPMHELPLYCRKRAIAAVLKLSKVCGYGTAAIHATLKKLMRPS
jgi:hypothetical protein